MSALHEHGDVVHHKGVTGTVVRVDGNKVLVQRHFNGLKYWDDQDYWEPKSDDMPSVTRLEAIFIDQGKPTK